MIAFGAVALLGAAGFATAETVKVTVTGTVDYNVIQGAMGGSEGTPSGTPVTMSFDVDSNSFLNSESFPTRGYPIDLSSFSMQVGAVNVSIVVPQPDASTPYFVIRDNDPAVDGFFVSPGVDWAFPITVTIPGLEPEHELSFHRTFDDATPLPSLNILDAVGSYDTSNLSSFGWSVGRFGNAGAEYNYETISLAVVPEPSAAFMAMTLVALAWSRKTRSD
jgi:hypothetical protein